MRTAIDTDAASYSVCVPRQTQRTPELRARVLCESLAVLAADEPARFTTPSRRPRARTWTPAVYELFGDKAGLVRGMFFEGFRTLGRAFDRLAPTRDPRADPERVIRGYRAFIVANPALAVRRRRSVRPPTSKQAVAHADLHANVANHGPTSSVRRSGRASSSSAC
jgi:hypothetical protein